MKNEFDVIIPVHNSEKYLEDCLQSVEKQSLYPQNLIIINDGSTDNSSKIIKNFKSNSKIKSIKIYENKNSLGVSKARNQGLEMVKSAYVTFVDSDDVLNKDHFYYLMKNVIDNNFLDLGMTDRIIFQNLESKNQNVKFLANKGKKICKNAALKQIMGFRKFQGYVTTKIFKMDVIRKNNIHFEEKINICEDLLFCVQFLCRSSQKYVGISQYRTYLYRVTNAGLSSNPSNKILLIEKSKNELEAYSKIKKELIKSDTFNSLVDYYDEKYIWVLNNTIYYLCELNLLNTIDNKKINFNIILSQKCVIIKIIFGFFIPLKPKVSFIFRFFKNVLIRR